MANRRWFLSYNSQDIALAERVERILRQKDSGASIFFAPTSLRAGGYWLPELAKEIAAASAFILLVGERGLGPWQVTEYYEALDRRVKQPDFPLVLILLQDQLAPGLPFLRQLHWIVTPEPASDKSISLVIDAASGAGGGLGELWRYTAPYRGLAAMTEADSDYFFGRERETVEVINALSATRGKIPILLGNSGVGKSSLARAGVLASFMREGWPETTQLGGNWPSTSKDSRQWCYLTLKPGTEPVTALVETIIETWRLDRTSTDWPRRRAEWVSDLIAGKLTLRDLLDQTRRRFGELQQIEPPAYLLYIDQGEELYVRAEASQRRCFSEILAKGVEDSRLYAFMSLRADFFGELQKDEALYRVHCPISVAPLWETELRDVVARPAALLGAKFETKNLAQDIARRAAEESTKDAGALPLLSYLLDDMWRHMVERNDGTLRLPANAIELGGVLVDRADQFVSSHPGCEAALRRILTLKLATVREDGEPTRRRALRSEFSDEEWQLVCELADFPNRLLNTATLDGIPGESETYSEIAHEAIFRRWEKLRDWITAEREFLTWRSGLEAARRAWQATPESSRNDALLMGWALAKAQSWLAARPNDIPKGDGDFISASVRADLRRKYRLAAVAAGLAATVLVGIFGWIYQDSLGTAWRVAFMEGPYKRSNFSPYVLTAARQTSLRPLEAFRECEKECPDMVVVPAGHFLMGAATADEWPVHTVVIRKAFAVSKYPVTFAEWDACAHYGDCLPNVVDSGFGRGQQPVINVSWADANHYAAWLSKMTGNHYRLLSEAEYEYAVRAGTTTPYWWGTDAGSNHANCNGCGSKWDDKETSPVGSFPANAFGLFDMVGNVWEWTSDCYHNNYNGAPSDGSSWQGSDCGRQVLRGASWGKEPQYLGSAIRVWDYPSDRDDTDGFRVARDL